MQTDVAHGSPFQDIKVRGLVIWTVFATVPAGVIYGLLGAESALSEPMMMVFATAWPLIWVQMQFRHHHIRLREFLGGMPEQKRWLAWILTVAGLVSLAIGAVFLIWHPLSYIAPDLVENLFLSQHTFFSEEGVPRPLEAVFFDIACGTVLAPFVEEVCFRGIILHRWALRWGLRASILLSSLLFAILHLDVVGALVFGIVMCILYLRTRSLWVPIFCHALHNALAYLLEGMNYLAEGPVKSTLEDFRSELWLGVVCLAVGLPWAIVYLKKHWPAPDCELPQIHAAEEPATTSPQGGPG